MKHKWKWNTKLENETRGSSPSYSSALKYFFYCEFIKRGRFPFSFFPRPWGCDFKNFHQHKTTLWVEGVRTGRYELNGNKRPCLEIISLTIQFTHLAPVWTTQFLESLYYFKAHKD